ncbi:hypothetical protein CHS0354_011425 [Potamilus streckersoni]|uniref:VWFD domain-containing protein n=1 Tax=Potamilus streckersoni TaxID=2493646 RepID=A0AAE0WD11_9BIVA|nr:hypothetical protein CHS0354_011425 [Potamilus streckersoni]
MRVCMVLVLFLYALQIAYGQECVCNTTNDTLHDLERRARNYIVAQNEPFVVDGNTLYKCYNVGNKKMPTNYTNLQIGVCGTYFPVWMNGTHPGDQEGLVNRTACTMSFAEYCAVKQTIQVLNCGTHNLYKLRPTSSTSGYCFDTLPDIPDLQDPPRFQPASAAVKHHLTYIDKPIVGSQNVYKKPMLVFSCEFNQSANETLFYKVVWYVNEVTLLTKGPKSYAHVADTNLDEDELVSRGYKLDITIKCGVRASKSVDGFQGNMTTSPGFWVGIQILSISIKIKQGQTGIVQLKSTVPFGCAKIQHVNDPGCVLEIHMYDDLDSYNCQSTSVSVVGSQMCGSYIQGSTWEKWLNGTLFYDITNMTITTKDKNDYNLDISAFTLLLKTPRGTTVNTIMEDNHLHPITVQIEAETTSNYKNCYVRLDPHMKTFDQRNYENQNSPGEFILYRHTSYKQEVQIKTYLCYKSPNWVPYDITCVCAVSVRAGGEIFVIDVCAYPVLIRHVSCKERLMLVRKLSEYNYEIHMPLGTMVVVSIENWPNPFSSLNIDVMPSVKDVNKTEGLCGVLNNNPNDDFKTPSGGMANNEVEFRDLWRVHVSKSFLNSLNHNPDYWEEKYYLCVCPRALQTATSPSLASGNDTHPLCSPSVYLACTAKVEFPGKQYDSCNIKSKHSDISHSRELLRILSTREYDKEMHYEERALRKRSALTYTMEEARRTCEEIFNRSCVAVKFEGLTNNTVSKLSALHDCALDLNATSDLQLVDIHCSSFSAETERYIRQDSVRRLMYKEMVQEFYASVCINNCNGHGECINGSCVCHNPYIEIDCSISKMDLPVVVDTYMGGFCSGSSDQCCGTIPMYGKRLVEGVTKQKLKRFQVLPNGTMEILETIVREPEIFNAFEANMLVPCVIREKRSPGSQSGNSTFPLAVGIVVSLSNDGTNYGPEESYYIYDMECVGYNNNTNGIIFNVLNEKCYIDGVCYSQGDKDPTDACKECRHANDPFSFSDGCTSSKMSSPSSSDNLIIIVASVLSAVFGVAMFVIISMVIIKCCLINERRVAGNIKINVMPMSSAKTKFHEGALHSGQKNVPDNEPKKERESSFHNTKLWGDRPGTAMDISFEFPQTPHPY